MAYSEVCPYYPDEQTWAWSSDAITRLMQLEVKGRDIGLSRPNPDKPGWGVHVISHYAQWDHSGMLYAHMMRADKTEGVITGYEHEGSEGFIRRQEELGVDMAGVRRGRRRAELAQKHSQRNPAIYDEIFVRIQALISSRPVIVCEKKTPYTVNRKAKRETGKDMDTPVFVVEWPKPIEVISAEKSGDDEDVSRHRRSPGEHSVREHLRVLKNGNVVYVSGHRRGSGPLKTRPTVNVTRF